MKAREVREFLLNQADWVDREKTVDTFKHGDPDVEVRSIAVTWMLTMEAIAEAERLGVDLVVTHEPTFYSHHDDLSLVALGPLYRAKRKRLEAAGFTVLRIHDTWDPWPEIGVGDALATCLELTEIDRRDRYRRVYATREPMRLAAFAAFVRDRLSMRAVEVMGDGDRVVARVGLSYGALGGLASMQAFLSMQTDVIVAGELCRWCDVRYLQDAGCALVITSHADSENPGLRQLAGYLSRSLAVPAHFIEVTSPLRTHGA